jgi:acyl-[acyl-carrier-protein]-phospholipid O-acyltransferase / long-chain-fatty-acid--[acyl-carrier-protein] ligase
VRYGNGGRVKTNSQKVKPLNISEARKKFAAMATCYFLGTFNDNFFKQAVLLLAVTAVHKEFQGYALMMFTLPFVVFAAYAGWLADKFSKRRVVIAAKWMELMAMVAGGIGIVTGSWVLIFTMLAIMGTQATIFSPAINGSIPELYSGNDVVKANGIFRMAVMTAILFGSGVSGFVLDIPGTVFFDVQIGKIILAGVIVAVALLGVMASYAVYSRDAADPKKPFPWKGPFDTIRVLYKLRTDVLLSLVIILDVFIWFAGSIQILLINPLGVEQFNFSKSKTSLLLVAQLLGIGIGGLISSRFTKGSRWYRILIPAGLGMSLCMGLVASVPYLPYELGEITLFASIGCVGLFGGLFMIPLESFIQIRPSSKSKGTVWASANFIIFTGIIVSGSVGNFLNSHFEPTQGFGIMSAFSFLVSLFLVYLFRKGDLK